jgi:hypothetical protein
MPYSYKIFGRTVNKRCLDSENRHSFENQLIWCEVWISFHGLGRMACSGIDALPSFPGASTISSPSGLVVEGVFRKFGVVNAFEMVDPVSFVFESHSL